MYVDLTEQIKFIGIKIILGADSYLLSRNYVFDHISQIFGYTASITYLF